MDIAIDQAQDDDLPEKFYTIANEIGIDNTIKLAKVIGGEYIYIPKVDKILASIRNKNIRKEFNGYNYKELGKKYNLTEIQIRNICKDIINVKKAEPMQGQISFI